MSDTGFEPDDELEEGYDPDEVDETDGESGGTAAFGRSFGPPPDGFVTATGFAKLLEETNRGKVRPQVIFATAKSSKTFPARRHPEDGRIIVPVKEGLEWWDEKAKRTGS